MGVKRAVQLVTTASLAVAIAVLVAALRPLVTSQQVEGFEGLPDKLRDAGGF